ncbi:MAG: Dabb family protein [Halanaerobium sp. MSAO_Bac5]|nr:MAG: Dabb family protein [Halanaerobium sp. MSAO_Bac5]
MIKHVVMWEFKNYAEGNDKDRNIALAKQKILALKDLIDLIEYIEVGINLNESEAAYDLVLISDFKSLKDLDKYQKHPEHQKVVDFVKKVVDKRVVVDYEV